MTFSWGDIFPLWIYTRQGKWWTTGYDDIPDHEWVYVLAISKTRDPRNHADIVYPIWDTTAFTKDRIIAFYDNWEEAKSALHETLDELVYIAAGWRVSDGDTLSYMSYVWGQPSPLRQGVGLPPTPPPPRR